MRLTLRTLLAYMDDILEPQDHDELEKRIEASDFAHDLIHRTRDTMRRLRLTAPAIKGEGMGLDPNTVAEYLDNTLGADQVADFERVCLESDVHLAEVASCHHVLTMVLGEPAEIDPDVRRRMYALPSQAPQQKKLRIEPAHIPKPVEVAGTVTVAMAAPVAMPAPVRRVEVPDYLRAAEPSFLKRFLPAAAALLVLAGVSYFAFRPGGWLRENAQLAENVPPAKAPGVALPLPAAPESTVPPDVIEQPVVETEPPAAMVVEADAPVTVETTTDPQTGETETTVTVDAPPAGDDAADAVESDTVAVVETAELPLAETPPLPPQPIDPVVDATAVTPSPVIEEPVLLPPDAPITGTADVDPDGTVALPSEVDDGTGLPEEMPPEAAVTEGTADAVVDEAAEPAGPPTLGTFSSARQVLLWLGPDGSWMRVPPRSPIVAGSELLALPTYRPMVDLATGLNAELLDGTLLKVDVADKSAPMPVPQLTLVYGRALLINTAMAELSVPIRIGEVEATVRLEPNATVAIDAKRTFEPGTDAAQVAAPVVASLYAPVGGVVWQSPDATLEVPDPGMWQLAGDSVGPVEPYPPTEWIDGEGLRLWEQMSSPAIERLIAINQPVDVQLLGLYDSTKRKEEKALLTECSMHVGQFVPVVRSLKDRDQYPEWEKQIASLREAMARSPELAQQVLDTLVAQEGDEKAADLYQMLCGFSFAQVGTTPEEVQTGALKQLIDWLESDQLNYRVLAFNNLKAITGKTLSYNPTGTADSRARAVRQWRQRLKDNELVSSP
ncbi:MAG: hypothetical protein WD851_16435 [Pirellulales bacterium]